MPRKTRAFDFTLAGEYRDVESGFVMPYLLAAVVVALATAAMTEEFPRTRARIGVVSLAAAVVAVTIALVTANFFLYYLGSLAGIYGFFVLLALVAAAVRDDGGRLYRDK